jgi:hypothetical protein
MTQQFNRQTTNLKITLPIPVYPEGWQLWFRETGSIRSLILVCQVKKKG